MTRRRRIVLALHDERMTRALYRRMAGRLRRKANEQAAAMFVEAWLTGHITLPARQA